MTEVVAFLRHDLLTMASYRVRTIGTVGGLLLTAVPVYLIADALQPTMAASIREQGDHYFSFLIVGMATHRLVIGGAQSMPRAFTQGIRTGTLEALFSTPLRLPALLGGMTTHGVIWAFGEAAVLVTAAWILGADFTGGATPAVLLIMALIALAHVPFGLIGAAGVLAFRTAGPVPNLVSASALFLGGVLYPTTVMPSGIELGAAVVPLTYGLRALRRTWLEGLPFSAVLGDVGVLLVFTVVLTGIGYLLFRAALRYARTAGTLAQY